MSHKAANNISIIGGTDGPTSVFLVGKKSGKLSLKQKMHKLRYNYRKKRAIKSIKANPHSMDDVMKYIKSKYGFVELSKDTHNYQDEYKQMRSSFILQYRPDLLGDLSETPTLQVHTIEGLQAFMQQLDLRQAAAEKIPVEQFDIDFHIFEKLDKDYTFRILLEVTHSYIGGSSSGSKKDVKEFNNIYRDIHKYYGVSQDDINQQTERYQSLIRVLAQR